MKNKATLAFLVFLWMSFIVAPGAHSQSGVGGTWTTASSNGSSPRYWFTSSVVNDKFFVIGGIDGGGNIVNTNEVFTPASAGVKNNDAVQSLDMEIAPNPTYGPVTVYNIPAGAHVTIESILGEIVMEVRNTQTSDATIDLSKLPAGTYFARIVTPNSLVMRKIVRE